jgi:glycine cleavage system H protein
VKPEELLFAKTHEWAKIDSTGGGKVATIGLSAFALEALTDLVYMQLPTVGRKVKAGESIGEIESVKAVSDIYSPIDGEITEVNSDLATKLETLNADPYGAGWIAKIKITDESALKNLLDYTAYQKVCAEEQH